MCIHLILPSLAHGAIYHSVHACGSQLLGTPAMLAPPPPRPLFQCHVLQAGSARIMLGCLLAPSMPHSPAQMFMVMLDRAAVGATLQ